MAAAISAAFAAPLAGILFAHEVVLRHYSLRFFAPVTLASASAYVFSGEVLNQHIVMLPILSTRMAGPVDIFLLLVLGLAAGLLAVGLMRGLDNLRARMVALPLPLWGRPVLARSGGRPFGAFCARHIGPRFGCDFRHAARRDFRFSACLLYYC